MSKKSKKYITRGLIVTLILFGIFVGSSVYEYIQFQKVVEAVGGMPTTDAGTVTTYMPVCVATPPDGVCKNCASCGPKTGNYVCAGFSEITLSAQKGTTEICPVKSFVYSGGGVMPSPGRQIIYGGASNLLPWVIGVPGASVSKTQKVIDFFKVLISGEKEK